MALLARALALTRRILLLLAGLLAATLLLTGLLAGVLVLLARILILLLRHEGNSHVGREDRYNGGLARWLLGEPGSPRSRCCHLRQSSLYKPLY
jgi:hypothetical protein